MLLVLFSSFIATKNVLSLLVTMYYCKSKKETEEEKKWCRTKKKKNAHTHKKKLFERERERDTKERVLFSPLTFFFYKCALCTIVSMYMNAL